MENKKRLKTEAVHTCVAEKCNNRGKEKIRHDQEWVEVICSGNEKYSRREKSARPPEHASEFFHKKCWKKYVGDKQAVRCSHWPEPGKQCTSEVAEIVLHAKGPDFKALKKRYLARGPVEVPLHTLLGKTQRIPMLKKSKKKKKKAPQQASALKAARVAQWLAAKKAAKKADKAAKKAAEPPEYHPHAEPGQQPPAAAAAAAAARPPPDLPKRGPGRPSAGPVEPRREHPATGAKAGGAHPKVEK
jgi:hypothetical protein